MHILVAVKRVVDPNVRVRVRADAGVLDTAGLKMTLNPFDEVALEQAVRLREAGMATKVTVVACDGPAAQDVLRTALAMGADAAVLVDTSADATGGHEPARLLAELVRQDGADLVLCGKQAIDDDLGDTVPMLAALLDWPQALSVHRMEVDGTGVQVHCDGDVGVERWHLPLPAVLGVDLRLCDARAVSLPNLMKARKAPLRSVPAAQLESPRPANMRIVGVAEPAARPAGVRVADVQALLERLAELPALRAVEQPR